LDPRSGAGDFVPGAVWLVGGAIHIAAIVGLYTAARAQRRAAFRAALLGAASGLGYGLTAAFTKGMASQYGAGGIGGILSSWQLYACGVAGLCSTWLLQNAYHSGTLAAAQPGITLLDPVVATCWGAVAFGEHVRHGWVLLAAPLPLAAMTFGVIALSRSHAWQRNEDRPGFRPEPIGRSRAPLR